MKTFHRLESEESFEDSHWRAPNPMKIWSKKHPSAIRRCRPSVANMPAGPFDSLTQETFHLFLFLRGGNLGLLYNTSVDELLRFSAMNEGIREIEREWGAHRETRWVRFVSRLILVRHPLPESLGQSGSPLISWRPRDITPTGEGATCERSREARAKSTPVDLSPDPPISTHLAKSFRNFARQLSWYESHKSLMKTLKREAQSFATIQWSFLLYAAISLKHIWQSDDASRQLLLCIDGTWELWQSLLWNISGGGRGMKSVDGNMSQARKLVGVCIQRDEAYRYLYTQRPDRWWYSWDVYIPRVFPNLPWYQKGWNRASMAPARRGSRFSKPPPRGGLVTSAILSLRRATAVYTISTFRCTSNFIATSWIPRNNRWWHKDLVASMNFTITLYKLLTLVTVNWVLFDRFFVLNVV